MKFLCVITVTHQIWFQYRFLSCRPRLDVYSCFGQPLTKQLYKSKSIPHFIKMNCKRLYWRNRVAKSSSYTVLLGSVYTNAVSNRHGFMPLKPHRKRNGFKAFTRCQSHRFQVLTLCRSRSQELIIEEEDLGSIITWPFCFCEK